MDTAALLEQADEAYEREDYAEAMRLYRPLADQGNAEAQYYVGWIVQDGLGVPRDVAAAHGWFLKAANQGHMLAERALGYQYHKGEGVSVDYAEALRWYRKAAAQGDPHATFQVAFMYGKGQGVRANPEQARKMMTALANTGDEYAQQWLRENPQKASRWKKIAVWAVIAVSAAVAVRYSDAYRLLVPIVTEARRSAAITHCDAGWPQIKQFREDQHAPQDVFDLLIRQYEAHPLNLRAAPGLGADVVAEAYLVTNNPDVPTDAKITAEAVSQSGLPYIQVTCKNLAHQDSQELTAYIVGQADVDETKKREGMMVSMYRDYNRVLPTLPSGFSDPNPPVIGHATARGGFFLYSVPDGPKPVFEWGVYNGQHLEILKGRAPLPAGWVYVRTIGGRDDHQGFTRQENLK